MENISNAERWEMLKQAVEAARVRVGKEMSIYDVSCEISYNRGDFSDREIEEAIYLLTDNVPASYRAVVDVVTRFLKRRATFEELRAVVRAVQGNGYTLITCTWSNTYAEERGETVYSLSEAKRLAREANSEFHGALCTMEIECPGGGRIAGSDLY